MSPSLLTLSGNALPSMPPRPAIGRQLSSPSSAAHISPAVARWITAEFGEPAQSVRDLGLRSAKDKDIFAAARQAQAIVMSKDADFAEMVDRLGPPPAVVWLTCGNTSNAALRALLKSTLPRAIELIARGDALVEIS
jgi:predicted nuclease of predicted toxin-antitoxin system